MDTAILSALGRQIVGTQPHCLAVRPSIDAYESWLEGHGRLTPFVADMFVRARIARSGHDVVVYMAGALTGARQEDKERYGVLAQLVAGYSVPGARMFGYVPHLHGTDPVAHPDVSEGEVHDVDLLWSTFVADVQLHCMQPIAHGNGAEAGWASIFGVHAVYLTPADKKVSRLMLGTHNLPTTLTYDSFDQECLPQVRCLLASIQASLLDRAISH